MRDLMFAIAMLIALPLAIARPLNAYLLWGWSAVMIPTSYFYGFMVSARVNFLCAVLTIALVVLRRVDWSDYKPNRVVWLYLIFLFHGTLAFALGYPGNPDNAKYYELLVKLMVFCLLMPMFIHNRLHIHTMLIVLVLGLGLHGVLDGLKMLASGGSHIMYGPNGTMIYDRNHLSTALTLVLPITYYLYLYSKHKLIRLGFLGAFGFIVLAIMGGGSRGGFASLAIVGFWLILTTRYRWSTLFFVIVLGFAVMEFAPASWTERLSTMKEADADESFLGRVLAWKVSSAMALNNPVFGGGFHAVQVQSIWDMFKNAPSLLGFLTLPDFSAKAAHSIYFEVMGDMGFVGLAIFLTILGQGIYSRFQIKRMVAELGPEYVWARDMGDMLMLGIIAYMAGGAFVSLAYLEAIYMVVMLMELLRMHVRRELLARTKTAPQKVNAPVPKVST